MAEGYGNTNCLREDFFSSTYFQVGDRTNIKFWTDKWLGDTTLKEAFPTLFLIEDNPDSLIAHNREVNTWNPIFRRNLHDWEVDEFIDMMKTLEKCSINSQLRDKLKWGNSKDGLYTVKAGYANLCSNNLMIDLWPWKLIWKQNFHLK